jgi:hypothetical protein
MNMPNFRTIIPALCFVFIFGAVSIFAQDAPKYPWSDSSLSPDVRADLVLKEMTLDEKIDLLHGNGMPGWPEKKPRANAYLGIGGAGFVLGVSRLGTRHTAFVLVGTTENIPRRCRPTLHRPQAGIPARLVHMVR